MFEGSLVESRGLAGSGTERWTALGSLTLQLGMAGLLMAIPLLRPAMLPLLTEAPRVELPPLPKPPLPQADAPARTTAAAALSLPAEATLRATTQRPFFPHTGGGDTEDMPPTIALNLGMGPAGSDLFRNLRSAGVGAGPSITVARAKPVGRVPVSAGVTAGMLLSPIRPEYPAIARAAHVQGVVTLEAVISKAGRIESLHAVSGPEMLRPAAIDAMKAARYRPYLLSGDPVEVQTTITVVFRLEN